MDTQETTRQFLAKIKPTPDGTCYWEGCQEPAETRGTIHTLARNIPYHFCRPHFISAFTFVMSVANKGR